MKAWRKEGGKGEEDDAAKNAYVMSRRLESCGEGPRCVEKVELQAL